MCRLVLQVINRTFKEGDSQGSSFAGHTEGDRTNLNYEEGSRHVCDFEAGRLICSSV